MTDLSGYSDAELEAIAGGAPDVSRAMPALIAQESGGRPGVLGPQTPYGRAEGMTQMLPATAREMATKLGVPWRPELMRAGTPEGAAYQQQLGQAYLEQGLAETGNMEDAFRYYHGGPNRNMWGPKTNAYAQQVSARMGAEPAAPDWSGMSDAELAAIAGEAAAPAAAGPRTTTATARPPAPRPAAATPRKSQMLGVAEGIAPAIGRYGQVLEAITATNPVMRLPAMGAKAIGDFASDTLNNAFDAQHARGVRPGLLGQIAGGVAATLPTMGLGAAAGGGASGFLLSQADSPLGVVRDVAIGAAAGKVADEAVRLLGRIPRSMTRPQLEAARNAAYQAVDNVGLQFKPEAYDDLVGGIADEMAAARLNPMRHPKAASMLDDIRSLRGKPTTLTELDQLRQVIRRDVASSSDEAERFFGQKMIRNIDEFIQAAGPDQVISGDPAQAATAIRTARDLHTRLKKLDTFEEALGKADLRAASTGSGGNVDNATRQNVRRVIETTRNLTPAERKAAERVVRGGPVQNTLRTIGKLSPQGNGLMTALGIGGAMTNPVLGIPSLVGVGAKAVADAMTRGNTDDLLRLIINGGRPAARVAPSAVVRRPVSAAASAAMVTARPVAAKERK